MVSHFTNAGLRGGFVVNRDVYGRPVGYIAGTGIPIGNSLDRSVRSRPVKDTDPVAPNGEFVIDTTDITMPGYGLPFTFTRPYRSGVMYSTALGYGWNHDFARRIVRLRTTPTAATPSRCANRPLEVALEVAYVDGQMNRVHFVFASTSGNIDTFSPTAADDLKLTFDHAANEWILVGDGDVVLHFDAGWGTLKSIRDYAGHTISVTWDHSTYPEWNDVGGVVTSVVDTTGRLLHFNYAEVTASFQPKSASVPNATATGHALRCISTAADCSSEPPFVTFDVKPIVVGDDDANARPVKLTQLELNLTGVHVADGSSVSYAYDDSGNSVGGDGSQLFHGVHALPPQASDADPLCHELCDADDATCSTVDACQRAIDEMQVYMCGPIHMGPTGFTVNRASNGAITSVLGPSVDYPNPGMGCYEICMSEYYAGGTAAQYRDVQGSCIAAVENGVVGNDGKTYDQCAVKFLPDCNNQLAVLQANIDSCRSSCVTSCKASFGANPQSYFDGLGRAHRIVRVTDGEGRIVVDNRYGSDTAAPDYGRVLAHAQGAALPGDATTTMTFAYSDVSPAPLYPMFCTGVDPWVIAHLNTVVDTADAFGNAQLHFVHAGIDGSALAATDPSGTVLEAYAYSAYGETTFLDGAGQSTTTSRIGNRYLFQGQLYDAQLGAYAMRAREYKPAWGRFLSMDPAGLAFGDNRYAFVDGRPLTMWDPTGLCERDLYEQAAASGFDGDAVMALNDHFYSKYGVTTSYAREMASVRSTAMKVNWHAGNYGRAAFNAVFGAIDAVGSTVLGKDNVGTAQNVAFGLATGYYVGKLATWIARSAPVWRPIGSVVTSTSTGVGATGGAVAADQLTTVVNAAADATDSAAAGGLNGQSSRIAPGGGLSAHEADGGHLIARHIGRSEADLQARLASEPHLSAASTFLTREEAEAGASAVFDARAAEFANWVSNGAQGKLVLNAPYASGMVLSRGATATISGANVRLVLRGTGAGGWYILTGFPTP